MNLIGIGKWLVKQFRALNKDVRKLLVSGLAILLGGSLPLPSMVSAGLVLGGIFGVVSVLEPVKKRGKRRGKKK